MRDYLPLILGVFVTLVFLRGYLNSRERQRARKIARFKAQHGLRDFAGRDWSAGLPRHERHETLRTKQMTARTTHGHAEPCALAQMTLGMLVILGLAAVMVGFFSDLP